MVLFICSICKYGHSILNVEQFYDKEKKIHCYLCHKHLSHRTSNMIHLPFSKEGEGCSICDPDNDNCSTFHLNPILYNK